MTLAEIGDLTLPQIHILSRKGRLPEPTKPLSRGRKAST